MDAFRNKNLPMAKLLLENGCDTDFRHYNEDWQTHQTCFVFACPPYTLTSFGKPNDMLPNQKAHQCLFEMLFEMKEMRLLGSRKNLKNVLNESMWKFSFANDKYMTWYQYRFFSEWRANMGATEHSWEHLDLEFPVSSSHFVFVSVNFLFCVV